MLAKSSWQHKRFLASLDSPEPKCSEPFREQAIFSKPSPLDVRSLTRELDGLK